MIQCLIRGLQAPAGTGPEARLVHCHHGVQDALVRLEAGLAGRTESWKASVWVRQLEALRGRNDALAEGLERALRRGATLEQEAATAALKAELAQARAGACSEPAAAVSSLAGTLRPLRGRPLRLRLMPVRIPDGCDPPLPSPPLDARVLQDMEVLLASCTSDAHREAAGLKQQLMQLRLESGRAARSELLSRQKVCMLARGSSLNCLPNRCTQ
jgi:hypothetical protein